MNIDNFIDKILDSIGKSNKDYLSPRSGILLYEVLESLITLGSMKESALVFDKTDSAFENLIRRNLYPLFPYKGKNLSWDNYLLSICGHKKCPKCYSYKLTSLFYKNTSYCISCTNIGATMRRPKYLEGNRARSKKHYLNNKHEYILKASKRRRLLYRAMPVWANLDKLKEIYTNCPEGMHVDHIIPLQGDLVCGLHVENNLQYLTAEENLKKSNKFLVE